MAPKEKDKKSKIPAKQGISKSSKKKRTKRKAAKNTKPKKSVKKDAESNVGYKRPPKEHQFPPGQSGNPNGPPKRKTQLWVWLCKYMDLNDAELVKLDRTKLTQAKQYALNLVENMKSGKGPESERFARHIFDREEGKAVEHIILGSDDTLTDEECDEVREELLRNRDFKGEKASTAHK